MSRAPSPLIPGEVVPKPVRRVIRWPLVLGVALLMVLWLLMVAYLETHQAASARQAEGVVSPAPPAVVPAPESSAPESSAPIPAQPFAPVVAAAEVSSSVASSGAQPALPHLALQAEIDTRLAATPLEFRYMKLTLRNDSLRTLRALAERVAAAEQPVAVLVRVHAHSWGTAERNLEISVQRADVIRREMIAAGLPASRVSAEGVGQAEPSLGRSERETRRLNRRTEIRIMRN